MAMYKCTHIKQIPLNGHSSNINVHGNVAWWWWENVFGWWWQWILMMMAMYIMPKCKYYSKKLINLTISLPAHKIQHTRQTSPTWGNWYLNTGFLEDPRDTANLETSWNAQQLSFAKPPTKYARKACPGLSTHANSMSTHGDTRRQGSRGGQPRFLVSLHPRGGKFQRVAKIINVANCRHMSPRFLGIKWTYRSSWIRECHVRLRWLYLFPMRELCQNICTSSCI